MNYFVHYHDDSPENGGVGLQICETLDQASGFIKNRLEAVPSKRTIEDYNILFGKELKREDWPEEIY